MSKFPKLSVIMSVYNGEDYLVESIESILNQTYRNFEFIIINDGSTDASETIISQFAKKDTRIVYIKQKNNGLAKSLNLGINKAKGYYIARQDADDVSFPSRFQKQLAFLDQNPKTVLCGTWFIELNENDGSKKRKYPVSDIDLRRDIKYVNNFCHPSVIFSKKAFQNAGKYDVTFSSSQDFELWIRLSEEGEIANVPEILVKKRIGFSTTISWQQRSQKRLMAVKVLKKHFNSRKDIDKIKFIKYYLPKMVYGYIPAWALQIIRKIRYH